MKALKDAERITHEATSALDAGDWAPERLEREREPTDGTQDALDQLVACARSLTEDVRRAASFIHGNASLLFRLVSWLEPDGLVGAHPKNIFTKQCRRSDKRLILWSYSLTVTNIIGTANLAVTCSHR